MAVYLGFDKTGVYIARSPVPVPLPCMVIPLLMAISPHPFPATSRMKVMPTGGAGIPQPSCMIHLAISPRVSSALLTEYPSSCSALAWLNRPLEASTPTE